MAGDHAAGIKATLEVLDKLYDKEPAPPDTIRHTDGSVSISVTGLSNEQIVETVVAAYLAARSMT